MSEEINKIVEELLDSSNEMLKQQEVNEETEATPDIQNENRAEEVEDDDDVATAEERRRCAVSQLFPCRRVQPAAWLGWPTSYGPYREISARKMTLLTENGIRYHLYPKMLSR